MNADQNVAILAVIADLRLQVSQLAAERDAFVATLVEREAEIVRLSAAEGASQ